MMRLKLFKDYLRGCKSIRQISTQFHQNPMISRNIMVLKYFVFTPIQTSIIDDKPIIIMYELCYTKNKRYGR